MKSKYTGFLLQCIDIIHHLVKHSHQRENPCLANDPHSYKLRRQSSKAANNAPPLPEVDAKNETPMCSLPSFFRSFISLYIKRNGSNFESFPYGKYI